MLRLSITRPGVFLLLVLHPLSAAAQASPLLSTDDPRYPLLEHLIARGEIRDPSPLVRPARRVDLVATLKTSRDPLAVRLSAALDDGPARFRGRLSARAGGQGFTQGRRDLLQSGGAGGVKGYADVAGALVAGPLVVAVRGSAENRLKNDPDWFNPADIARDAVVPRLVEAYAALQFSWGAFQLGQVARNWGPEGVPGVAVSDAGYPHPDLSVEIGIRAVRYVAVAARLSGGTDQSGRQVERYHVLHRLTVRASDGLTLAAWEAGIMAGHPDELDGLTRTVVPLLVVPALFASRAHRNEMVGGDISWRPSPRLRIEGELAIDDWNFAANNPYPQRWAGAVTGAGALGRRLSWSLRYSTASSLAFRTLSPDESFTDRGVGIGRLFPDNEEFAAGIGVPVADRWLVSPRVAILRQGEGRIQDPFPTLAEAALVPARFIGTLATSFWAGAAVAGWQGPFALQGAAGLRRTTNFGHVAGRGRMSFEARFTATLGLSLQGGHR